MEKLNALAAERKFKDAKELMLEYNSADIAAFLEEAENDMVILFRLLPRDVAAEVFAYMDSEHCEKLIESISDNELSDVINSLYKDDAVDLVEDMPANVVVRILAKASPETRKQINEILNYPEDSAGSILTTEFVSLDKNLTVSEAFAKIRREGIKKETIYTCYVTQGRRLIGTVAIKDMLFADANDCIEDLMLTNFVCVKTGDDKEMVANLFDKYDLPAIPVVDNEERIVGIVTFEDAIDVIREEASEDFTKMAAITPSDDTYFKTPFWIHAKNRLPWLLLLMFSSTITGLILSRYESAFSAVPILVTFIPMLMDTGGNCGSQSSTMIIRGLALEEIRFRDIFHVILKEFSIAMIVSPILAICNGIRIYLMYHDLTIALIIVFSLIFTVTFAKFIGAVLPMLAKRCGLDPALMASPFITTIVDMSSMAIYFALATAMIPTL